jgi:hypothetical protein
VSGKFCYRWNIRKKPEWKTRFRPLLTLIFGSENWILIGGKLIF